MISAFANSFKVPELRSRILFTLAMIVIVRIGTSITLPGVDPAVLGEWINNKAGDNASGAAQVAALLNIFSGGGMQNVAIFALGIMPYISASIMLQLLTAVWPPLSKLAREEGGRQKITQYTRIATIVLCVFQATLLAQSLADPGQNYLMAGLQDAIDRLGGRPLVPNYGLGFVITSVITITAGTMLMMWLGEQITERGLGNGASLIIFFSIVERMWPSIFQSFNFVSTGAVSPLTLVVLALVMVGVVAGVVAITVAARRVLIQIPQRTMARGRQREAARNFIPLRINTAGVMPIIFANSVIVIPGALAQFSGNAKLQEIAEYFNPQGPNPWLYFVLSAVLILLFTYFYTSIIFNPVDLAENLKKQGGFVPGIKPGAKTAEYIEQVVERITLPGAIFLTFIALMPIVIARIVNVPFAFGGTSLLIMVGVILDTLQQVESHLLSRHYDGLMKAGRIRGRAQSPVSGIGG